MSCYDRDYAPAAERAEARRRHLAAWPDAVDAAVTALDRVAAPVAEALLPAAAGLTADLEPSRGDPVVERALDAHKRLAAHLEAAAAGGHRDTALGRGPLERLLGAGEALEVDLGRLEERADAERDRLRAMLDEACGRLAPGRPTAEVVAGLLEDHPDADGVLREAEALTAESIAFTLERDLVPGLDGDCLVAPAPPSRRWALAMMSWAAPYEADAPSRYYISPPDPGWPADEQDDWLKVFSRTTLPAITVHEVAPGHFAHGRRLRQVTSDVRRTLHSLAFVEGWAHYGEEVCVEEGFRGRRPPLRRRGRPGGAPAGHPPGRVDRHPRRHHDRRRRAPPASRPTPSATARPPAPRPPGPPSTPPTAATPGASWRSSASGTRPAPAGAPATPTPASTTPCCAWARPRWA